MSRPASDAWPESLIATHSGLRGRPGVDLSDGVVTNVVQRFAALLELEQRPPTLGIARDGRSHSEALAAVAAEAALDRGLDVVDFGEVSTPAAKLASRRRGLGGAVVVTGSHLEQDWNGLKLVAAPLYGPVDIRALPEVTGGAVRPRGRALADSQATDEHVAAVLDAADAGPIRAAGLAVGWSGGAGCGPGLALERLGCRPPGAFPDLALVLDSDGDRVTLVDEEGGELSSEAVLPLVALACEARVVVRSADTSRMVDELMAGRGGAVHVVSPGELHLIEELLRVGADLAGEGNGGVVVPAVGLARDGLAAGVVVLGLMARAGTPLSKLAAGLPPRAIRRSTIPCRTPEEARVALAGLAAGLGAAPPESVEEGVVVERPGGAWGLVRRSATEAVLRLTAEARTDEAADALHAELRAQLIVEARA